jgi:hypothetical protein
VRRWAPIAGLCVALTLGSAAQASGATKPPRANVYSVTSAAGSVRVQFAGDPATCARSGVCPYHGTVTYVFAQPHGDNGVAFLIFLRGILVSGTGDFAAHGETDADVQEDVAAAPPCTDVVHHGGDFSDGFTVVQTGPSRARVTLHPDSDGSPQSTAQDYIDSHCAGPRDMDLMRAGALPARSYSLSRFRRQRVTLDLSGTRSFRSGGFAGTVTSTVKIALVRNRTAEQIFNGLSSQATPKFTG